MPEVIDIEKLNVDQLQGRRCAICNVVWWIQLSTVPGFIIPHRVVPLANIEVQVCLSHSETDPPG